MRVAGATRACLRAPAREQGAHRLSGAWRRRRNAHRQLSDERRRAASAGPDVIRLSIGLETAEDLIRDLDQALEAAGGDVATSIRSHAGGRLTFQVRGQAAAIMVTLSKHTADEMEGRGIRRAYIEAALASPDRVAPDPKDPTLTRSFKTIPEFGNRVLRVVHRPEGAYVFVVTAHWDRGARR